MQTVKDINNSLDKMSTYLFKNSQAFEVINLFRRRLYTLTKSEEKLLIDKYDSTVFPNVLEYIIHSFNFYSKNNVTLPVTFKQELILKFVIDYDQIVSSSEDLFHCKQNINGLTEKILERSAYNG